MTSLYMTSLHVDLAAKCAIIPPPLPYIASLLIARLHTRTKYKMATIFASLRGNNRRIFESPRDENLERTHDWCSAVGKVAF